VVQEKRVRCVNNGFVRTIFDNAGEWVSERVSLEKQRAKQDSAAEDVLLGGGNQGRKLL